MGIWSYIKNFASDKNVASFGPSSSFAINRVCKGIDFRTAKVIVEYGPGGGCFTEVFLKNLPADGEVLVFETNQGFVEELRAKFDDKRLTVYSESAENALNRLREKGYQHADYVVSGIPFSMIQSDIKDRIFENTAAMLGPRGSFLTYQVFPPAAGFDKHLKQPMERFFDVTRIEYELLNIPPYRIYSAVPKAA